MTQVSSVLFSPMPWKGFVFGAGLVYSNNGEDSKEALTHFNIEAGSLSEWNGKDWKLVRRNQFTSYIIAEFMEIRIPSDPIWKKSVGIISLYFWCEGKWRMGFLPVTFKSCHSYDGAHGWNTELTDDIGTPFEPNLLMTMHGLF